MVDIFINHFNITVLSFIKDTERVQPLFSRVEETPPLRAAATIWKRDKCQGPTSSTFWIKHVVPLLRQLFVQQGTKQFRRDCVHHIGQRCGICIFPPRGICQLTSTANDIDSSLSEAGTGWFYILRTLYDQSGHSLFESHHVQEPSHFLHVEWI